MRVSTSGDRSVDAFVAELQSLRKRIDRLEAGTRSTQLTNSSIENGSVAVYDGAGRERARIGLQRDGTFVGGVSLNNPDPPPIPAPPTVEALMGGLRVSTNGPADAPDWTADYSHANVYLQVDTSNAGVVGAIIGRAPSSFVISPLTAGTSYRVWLTAVNSSGAESGPSGAVDAVPNFVVGPDILDGAIGELQLAAEAVTAAKIALGAVGTAQIAGSAVDLTKLADGSVSAQKLIDGAVVTEKIAAEAIVSDLIAANAIIAGKIAASAITTEKLAAEAVSAEKIAALAISTEKLAADAVTADKIVALAISGDHIAANAIAAGHIQAGAITADKLQADLVITKLLIAGDPLGERAVLHPTEGLLAYDAANEPVARIQGANSFLRGEFIAGTESQGVLISPERWGGQGLEGFPRIDLVDAEGDHLVSMVEFSDGNMMLGRETKLDRTPHGGRLEWTINTAMLDWYDNTSAIVRSRVAVTETESGLFVYDATGALANQLLVKDAAVEVSKPIRKLNTDYFEAFASGGDSSGYRLVWDTVNSTVRWMRNSDNTYVSPVKSFVIDHPIDADRYLVHACTESPYAAVEYFGTARITDESVEVELPEYFEDLTEYQGRVVICTAIGYKPVAVAATYPTGGRFWITSSEPRVHVNWTVKAIRRGTRFDPEPLRARVNVQGDGPYRYIT